MTPFGRVSNRFLTRSEQLPINTLLGFHASHSRGSAGDDAATGRADGPAVP